MLSGILLALIIVGLAFAHNYYRNQNILEVELKPNCLLTRYPILFITGYKSLFYFMNYFNHQPDFLKEHGYEVAVLNLAWKSENSRNTQLLNFLKNAESQNKKFHIFYDESIHDEVAPLLIQEKYDSCVSINVLCEQSLKADQSLKAPPIPIFEVILSTTSLTFVQKIIWGFHQIFSFGRPIAHPTTIGLGENSETNHLKLLDHSVTLAEMDLKSS